MRCAEGYLIVTSEAVGARHHYQGFRRTDRARPRWVVCENPAKGALGLHVAGVAGVPSLTDGRADGLLATYCGTVLERPRVFTKRGVQPRCVVCRSALNRNFGVAEDYLRRLLEQCFTQVITNSKGEPMPRTQIFQHEDDVSVVTDAIDERDFIDTFAEALGGLKNGANRKAIAAGFDIVAKLRGYKSTVHERRMLAAGRWPHPSEQPVAEAGSDNEAGVAQDASR